MAPFLDPQTLVRVSTATITSTAYMLGRLEDFYSVAILKLVGLLGGWLTLLGIIYALLTRYYESREARETREAITGEIRGACDKLQADVKDIGASLRRVAAAALGETRAAEGGRFLAQKDPACALENYLASLRYFAEAGADADIEAAMDAIRELPGRSGALKSSARTRRNYTLAVMSLKASAYGQYAQELENLLKDPKARGNGDFN